MATRVTLTTRPDTTLAVVKTPLSGDRADRVAEAAWLRRASGRGAVELLESSATGFATVWVPGNTLRTGGLEPDVVAAVLAEVAANLAVLHAADLVHGKLSLDHVIVGPDGPVLCSPHGSAADTTLDSLGLGRCVAGLLERWDERGIRVTNRSAWQRLADRLADQDDPLPIRRAGVAFQRLASAPEPEVTVSTGSRSRPWVRPGLTLIVLAVVVSLGGLALVSRLGHGPLTAADPAGPAVGGPEVELDGDRYRVGEPGDVALVVDEACAHQPLVVLLDRDRSTVWRFDPSSFDADRFGAVGDAMAQVPGAVDLILEASEVSGDTTCPSVWAVGPAGRTMVVDNAQPPGAGDRSSVLGSGETGE